MASKKSHSTSAKQNREQQLRGIAENHDRLIEELTFLENRIELALENLAQPTSGDPDGRSC
ncbi:MAG: hypothetical protein RH917_16135 [Lacipirellulaceae bacterium]